MIALADQDLPTRSASGFLIRYIVPRMPPVHLFGPTNHKFLFNAFARFGSVIIGTGHGESDQFAGQNDDILLEVGKYNPAIVKGKFIKLLSCQTGDYLGPDLVEKGAIAYHGYTEDFLWVSDADYASRPWDDPIARRFLMPVVDGINAILDGKTSKEVFDIERSSFDKMLEVEDNELYANLLRWNRDASVMYGDPDAKVKPTPSIKIPIPPPLLGPRIY